MLMSSEQALKDVQAVVLDEIHQTYNSQRGFQLSVLLRRLEEFAGRPLQAVGLSATVANPADMWQFFRPGRLFTEIHQPSGKPLDYHICEVPAPERLIDLLNTLATGRETKAFLFANSRRECDDLASALQRHTAFGDHVFVHHSSLSRSIRLETERAVQEASTALCIATSTLELGIDIGDIDVILLYGHPGS